MPWQLLILRFKMNTTRGQKGSSYNPVLKNQTLSAFFLPANGWRRRLLKIVRLLVIAELAYLVLVNAILQLPVTQVWVSDVRPEKFSVSWEKAWSLYPFRIHVLGLSANGQSRSQQWQLDAQSAAGSIAVLPLLLKRVWIDDVLTTNIDYRQRPRLKPDKNLQELLPFFPVIKGREMTAAITTPRKSKRPWYIVIDDLRGSGRHNVWISHARGSGEGEISGSFRFQTQGGPFSLDVGHLDLQLDKLYLKDKQEVITQGTVAGTVSFAPFVPRQNKGSALLKFLSLDVDVDLDLNSLAFLNLFLLNLDGVTVDGVGQVKGSLHYAHGYVITGTDLSIDAEDLLVNILSHRIQGTGAVDLTLGPQTAEQFDLTFRFEGLQVHHMLDQAPLLTGQGLQLSIGGNGSVLVDPEKSNTSRSVMFLVDHLALPDLSLLQRNLPRKWPFSFDGGSGMLHGSAKITPSTLAIDLTLESAGADLGIGEYEFGTALELALKLDSNTEKKYSADLGGSYIRLTEAYLRREVESHVQSWDASIDIHSSRFSLLDETSTAAQGPELDRLRSLAQADTSQTLDNLSGVVDFQAHASSLAWIGKLFGEDYKLRIAGAGDINGLLHMRSGWPAANTLVSVSSDDLVVDVLDYSSRGTGKFTLQVEAGETSPDWILDLTLQDADFRRSGESAAHIQDVALGLTAVIPDINFDKEIKAASLNFRIDSATVSDVSTYNRYLPPDFSLQLTQGSADLSAAIELHKADAQGWIKFSSRGLQALVNEQSVSGDVNVDVLLVGGVPADMIFDISGSELRLDNVRIVGETAQFDGNYWSAVLNLQRAETTWATPLRLDMEAQLMVSDSRPLVAIFENAGQPPKFLSRMLTVEDIKGTAALLVADETLTIINAHAISDNLEIGAKGILASDNRNAMIYLRYKKSDVLLKLQNDKKNLDIIGVKKKFDAFRVDNGSIRGTPSTKRSSTTRASE
jgi:hypothetical protein